MLLQPINFDVATSSTWDTETALRRTCQKVALEHALIRGKKGLLCLAVCVCAACRWVSAAYLRGGMARVA